MKEWWNKKISKTRKGKKSIDNYTVFDFFLDVIFWIPELILFPLRLIFVMLRGLGRFIEDIL